MIADATVATTRPPKEPAKRNDMIVSKLISRMPSANRFFSNLTLMMRKLNATAIPIMKNSIANLSLPF